MENKNIFPGWEIVEEIGRGAFSTVYKVRKDDGMGGEYFSALKVISIPSSNDEYRQYKGDGYDDESISRIFKDQVSNIVSEFRMLSEFRGTANIVSYEDHKVLQKADGIGWDVLIRMELLSTLPDYYIKNPLTEKEVVKLGVDICNALILCEKSNIIHRDIKPQNIFVNKFGDFKLGDFGIARTMEHTTRATKIGTPAYMAPEVYRGEAYNCNVDVYSLGMVLYWLLNERRLPFLPLPPQVPTAEQTVNAQNMRLNGTPLPPPKNGSAELKEVVLRACDFDPAKRFANATAFKAALSYIYNAPAVTATATTAQALEQTVAVRKAPPASTQQARVQQAPAPQARPQVSTPPPMQAPTPQQRPKLAFGGALPPKKTGKKVLIAIICLLLVAGIGVGAYFLFFNKDDEDDDYGYTAYDPNINAGVNNTPTPGTPTLPPSSSVDGGDDSTQLDNTSAVERPLPESSEPEEESSEEIVEGAELIGAWEYTMDMSDFLLTGITAADTTGIYSELTLSPVDYTIGYRFRADGTADVFADWDAYMQHIDMALYEIADYLADKTAGTNQAVTSQDAYDMLREQVDLDAMSKQDPSATGTYTVNGNNITIKYGIYTDRYTYAVNGSTLTLTSGGETMQFRKALSR